MTAAEILSQQLTDIFRIGLLIALVATMLRTRSTTGTVVPLVAGIVFVAVVIPMTLPIPAGEPMWRLIALGAVANIIILAALGLAWMLIRRLRG
jgi:hypothetical protein